MNIVRSVVRQILFSFCSFFCHDTFPPLSRQLDIDCWCENTKVLFSFHGMHAGFRYSPVLEVLIIFHPKLIKRLERLKARLELMVLETFCLKSASEGWESELAFFQFPELK